MIGITVDTRRALLQRTEVLTSGSIGIEIGFSFSADWDGLAKIAVFRAGSVQVDMALTETATAVPWEVLEQPGVDLFVGVYGTDGETIAIPTVWCRVGRILPGAMPSDEDAEDATPSVVDQILVNSTTALQTAQRTKERVDELENPSFSLDSNGILNLV